MMRICSLLPAATEIAFALGLGDDVVGITHECDFPPAARDKPVMVRSAIDSAALGSAEIDRRVAELLRANRSLYVLDEQKLTQANPDVILTQALCDVCALDYNDVVRAARCLERSPEIISLNPSCLTDMLEDILTIGAATQTLWKAQSLVQSLKQRIAAVRNHAAQMTARRRVVCLEWFEPLYTAGHWVPEMVELAGGADVLGKPRQSSAPVDWQSVVASAPEVLILMPCGFDVERTVRESALLKYLDGWDRLPAVETERVFAVSGNDYFSRPGPRLIDGLEILSHVFQPQFAPPSVSSHALKRVIV
jgi:iron complex transport system substrate-binding protein